MRMWADTEFNEQPGQTISLGIVADNGDEFYEVLHLNEHPTKWVAANVMPVLQKEPISLSAFKVNLYGWLRQFDSIMLFVDHPADAQRFLQLLEVDLRGGWAEVPEITITILTGLPGSQSKYSMVEHNAISDARALRIRYLEDMDE
jgi:hypothetical protein